MSVNIEISQMGLPGPAGADGTDASSDASDIILFDDFISTTAVGGTGATNSSSGGGSVSIVSAESNHIGIASLSTGSSGSSGYSNIYWGSTNVYFGNGILNLEFLVRIPTLSTSSERYIIRAGFHDALNDDPTNGIYFKYDESTSANWIFGTSNNGTRTETTSSTVVTENTWIKLKISINATASSVVYYINGISIGSITTNIPITNPSGIRYHIIKSVGSSTRLLQIDYTSFIYNLTNSR
jgi:hypothetical protein